MLLSIVIPCYNEEKNIPLLVEKLASIGLPESVEIILVNNGSTDNSHVVFDSLDGQYPFLKCVHVAVNQGYGYGILQGLATAQGRYIGWTHADLQTDPGDILKVLHYIEQDTTNTLFIKGVRKNRPLGEQFFSLGMGLFESLYFGAHMNEINAQPTVFSKTFYQTWEQPPYDFSLDLYAYYFAKKSKLTFQRFDVLFPERIHGESSWNTGFKEKMKFIKRTLSYSRKLKRDIKEKA